MREQSTEPKHCLGCTTKNRPRPKPQRRNTAASAPSPAPVYFSYSSDSLSETSWGTKAAATTMLPPSSPSPSKGTMHSPGCRTSLFPDVHAVPPQQVVHLRDAHHGILIGKKTTIFCSGGVSLKVLRVGGFYGTEKGVRGLTITSGPASESSKSATSTRTSGIQRTSAIDAAAAAAVQSPVSPTISPASLARASEAGNTPDGRRPHQLTSKVALAGPGPPSSTPWPRFPLNRQ